MMSLLVFLVILFGVLGIITTQYITQCREAYNLWVAEIVYNDRKLESEKKKICEVCSKIEAFTRGFCVMHDLLFVVIGMICVTLAVVIFTSGHNLSLQGIHVKAVIWDFTKTLYEYNQIEDVETKEKIVKNVASLILTIVITIALPLVFYILNVSIPKLAFMTKEKEERKPKNIQFKLFEIWLDKKCHQRKVEKYRNKEQPKQLYEFKKKVEEGKIKVKDLGMDYDQNMTGSDN